MLKPAGATEVSVAEMTPRACGSSSRARGTASAPRWATRRPSCASAPTRRCGAAGLLEESGIPGRQAEPRPRYPSPDLEMTQRARRRHRRSRGSVRRKLLVVFGVLFGAVLLAVGGVAAWALSICTGRRRSTHLKPITGGLDLGRLRRRRQPPRLHPVGHDPPAREHREDPEPPQVRHGRDRGPQLLRARRRGLRRRSSAPRWTDLKAGAPVQGGSTITQQLVRNLYIAHPQDDIKRKIQEAVHGRPVRGQAHEALDPHQVPEHGLLRNDRRPHGGGGAGGGRDLLQQGRQATSTLPRGGDDRRPAAGALRVQPVPEPEGRPPASQRGAAGDGAAGLHRRRRLRAGPRRRTSAWTRGHKYEHDQASRTSSTTSSSS